MNKHTPGPWEVVTDTRKGREGRLSIRRVGTYESVVYQVDPGTKWHMNTHRADARLIAAAPELLEALVNLVTVLDLKHVKLSDYIRSQVESAIAKAKGIEANKADA